VNWYIPQADSSRGEFRGAETSSETSITSMFSKHRNHRWFVTTIDVFTSNSALGEKKL